MLIGQFQIVVHHGVLIQMHLFDFAAGVAQTAFDFLWIVDFPLLEYSEEDGRYYSVHHPFTRPHDEDLGLLESDPLKVRSDAYDIVLNGYELGGGSLRIYDCEMQDKIFQLLGLSVVGVLNHNVAVAVHYFEKRVLVDTEVVSEHFLVLFSCGLSGQRRYQDDRHQTINQLFHLALYLIV